MKDLGLWRADLKQTNGEKDKGRPGTFVDVFFSSARRTYKGPVGPTSPSHEGSGVWLDMVLYVWGGAG